MARAVVYFCTGNKHKLREVEEMMQGVPVEFRALDIDLPEIQGEPAEIAKAKCAAALEAHRNAIKGSSSSSSSSSNGSSSSSSSSNGALPEKWFLKKLGAAGLPKLLAGFQGCVVEPRGKTTFGWDCVFEEGSMRKTFGEMESSEKGSVSHRGRAMKQLKVHPNNNSSINSSSSSNSSSKASCVASRLV
ncbi:hypothetical protein Emag_000844 [Eimeria magna]